MLAEAFEYREKFGAWPDTWIAFRHGLAHLQRDAAARRLVISDATAAAHANAKDHRRWVREQRGLAGSL